MAQDLSDLDLDALMEVEITSASKKAQPLIEAPAAIYVIEGDLLRRMGVRTLPEALRLAPGLHVARIDGSDYSIGARAMNGTSISPSNKIEILMDGRSLYTPLFSGVLWDQQAVLIEDIERIEVIRGPGGTLWGANAVNGVINVVTRSATASEASRVVLAGGIENQFYAAARAAGRIASNGHARGYVTSYGLDDARAADGSTLPSSMDITAGGFRSDWTLNTAASLTVQGDAYDGESREATVGGSALTQLSGGNVLARMLYAPSTTRSLTVQSYVDLYRRSGSPSFGEERATFDLSAEGHWSKWGRHDIVAGVGYRRSEDETDRNTTIIFEPAERTLETWSAFVQDEIAVLHDKLSLIVGTKLEHNDVTGTEWQPNIRSVYSLDRASVLWGGVSRAVRIPNRVDEDLAIDAGTTVIRVGNPEVESEELIAYEVGYRKSFDAGFSLDIATYYNDLDRFQSIESDGQSQFLVENRVQGEAWGIELVGAWQTTDQLRLELAYSFQELDLETEPDSTDTTTEGFEHRFPRNLASLKTIWMAPRDVTVDAMLRYADAIRSGGQSLAPAYVELSTGIGWTVTPALTLRLSGNNLLDDAHREYGTGEIERNVEFSVEATF